MAPTRKRGANKAANNAAEFSLGDLVLAKVKGFPAWPAKVSRPEDWDRAPDPKKYFVQFFGTQEIAFITPADIQAFTDELKSKLLTRCQRKTVRHFAEAVKEICEAFEELQEKKSDGLGVDGDTIAIQVDDGEKKQLGVGSKRKRDDSADNMEGSLSCHNLKDVKPRKIASGAGTRKPSPDAQQPESIRGKIVKSLPSEMTKLDVTKNSMKDVAADFKRHAESKKSDSLGPEKHDFDASERSILAKRPKHVDPVKDLSMVAVIKNGKSDVSAPYFTEEKLDKHADAVNAEDYLGNKYLKGNSGRGTASDEALLPLAKCCLELSRMSDSSLGQKNLPHGVNKIDLLKKRRAIRLYDDDDNEPKTPLNVCSGAKGNVSSVSDSVKYSNGNHGLSIPNGQNLLKVSGVDSSSSPKEHILCSISPRKSSPPAPLLRTTDISKKSDSSRSPGKLETGSVLCNETEAALISPNKSSQLVVKSTELVEEQRPNGGSDSPGRSPHVVQHKDTRYLTKRSGVVAPTKTPSVSDRASTLGYDGLNASQSQVLIKKSKQLATEESSKVTPKANSRLMESIALVHNPRQNDSSLGGRFDDIKNQISSSADAKASDAAISIKDLIAAARNARMQNISHGNVGSVLTPSANIQGGSPSPPLTWKPVLSAAKTTVHHDLHGSHTTTSFVSPSSHDNQLPSKNQPDGGDHEDKRLSSGPEAGGVAVSGVRGTDAAVNRDAFEGMIETLSRTKESIGRATRLAIDCAKHGNANEVVDLLSRKLENEPSYHRRVDLFFLLDSITQCSHSQKGIAGASYIPAVQAALPRLLSAAAPPGARENRRQCLKVLRLWLERKILPESVLRCFMDDIGTSIDDINSGTSSRRPSRYERGVDDPLRDMETEQFDEYGSNATFQLDGIFPTRRFNDDEYEDEETPASSCKQVIDESPLEHALPELETEKSTPSDRHHHILEDVDGELEMEDVSGHPKDDQLNTIGSSGADMHESYMQRGLDLVLEDWDEGLSPGGSPPLPLEPPPQVPPLPSSPPPPSPPPLAPSSLPPPPPPAQSLAAPLHSISSLPPCHLQNVHLPSSLPPQGPSSLFTSHLLPQSLTLASSSSTHIAFRTPGNELSCLPSGNHTVQMTGNISQQSSTFLSTGNGVLEEAAAFSSSRSLDYGCNDMLMVSQKVHPKQHFQPGNVAFAQGLVHQVRPPQPPGNLHLYSTPRVQQNLQQPYRYSYSSSSLPDGRMQLVGNEQWRSSSVEYKTDCQHGTWMNDGRTQTGLTHFSAEGYFRPVADRPHSERSSVNHPSAAGAAEGHNNVHIFPSRSDMSSLNGWRQT